MINYIIFIIIQFFSFSLCDYYKTLGVSRNATEKEITSAYRKLAKVMHPDIAPDKEKEFVAVTEAYDVLKDPEKRAKYDRYGEEGVNQNYESGPSHHDVDPGIFENIFSQFGGFQFFTNDDRRARFQEDNQLNDFHGNLDDYNEHVSNTKCITLILLHHPQCGHCVRFKPTFLKLSKLYRTVEFLSVNCQRNSKICQYENIQGYPTLIAYKWPNYDKFIYHGDRSERSIDSWLHNTVIGIKLKTITTLSQLENFIQTSQFLPIVAIVNNPNSLILPSLAMLLAGKANLAIVLSTNSTIIRRLAPPYTPSLLSVLNIDDTTGEWYNLKKFDFDQIILNLRKDVAKYKQTRGGTKGSYKQLTSRLIESGECGPSDAQYCFIALVKDSNITLDNILKDLANKYRNEPIKLRFYQVSGNAPFGLQIKSGIKFVAYRPKRAKYKILDKTLNSTNIDEFINGVLEGSVKLDLSAQFFEFRQLEL